MLFLIGENGCGSYDVYVDYAKAIGDRIHPKPIYSRTLPIGVFRSHIVCVNGHLYEEAHRMFPSATFLFINMEQMVLDVLRKKVVALYRKNPNIIHIDYSQQNIDILRKEIPSLRAVWIPQLPPVTPVPVPAERSNSILFLGAMSGKRYEFLQGLATKLGMNVHVYSGQVYPNSIAVHDRLFGRVRDSIIRQSRIVLNIPIDDEHTIFPSLRIHWALYQGAHVVTFPFLEEPSWESPSLRGGLHVTSEFVATIQDILNKPPPTLEEQDYVFFNERIQALLKLF